MRLLLPLFCGAISIASALDIQIDYTYDTNNFFDTSEKRNAIETVAKFYGDLLQDNLLRIDSSEFSASSTWNASISEPSSGNLIGLGDLIIPEDTIIIFVGSRDLGGFIRGRGGPGGLAQGTSGSTSWITRIIGRGQAGVQRSAPETSTDVSLWGGTIAFDDDSTWNFSLEQNQSGVEFVRVALHEMGHVLGIGTSNSWRNLLLDGNFTGPAATAANGGTAPPADTGHFLTSLTSPHYGSFGATHGQSRPVIMLASSTDDNNNFDVLTDLDLAALIDIGWEVSIPATLDTITLSPSSSNFSWPSSSFCDYQIIRSTDLQTPTGSSSVFTGNGGFQSWSDPSPNATQAFYQLQVTNNTPRPKPNLSITTADSESEEPESIEIAPSFTTGCYCEEHSK